MRFFCSLAFIALFAGCQSAPSSKPAPAPAAAVIPNPELVAPPAVVPVEVLPERTEAALEARDLLLKGGQQHQVLMQSAFRSVPGFTVSNWSGLVLSPKDIKQGVVVGSGYKIDRVEIHPLSDGRLRVWVEVLNLTGERVQPEGACEFRPSAPDAPMLKFKALPVMGPQGKIIVFFESAHPQMESYSILVRNKR